MLPKTAKQPIVNDKSDIYIQYSVQVLAIESGLDAFAESGLEHLSSDDFKVLVNIEKTL